MVSKNPLHYNDKLNFFGEIMGLQPFSLRFRQAMIAVLGDEDVPKSNFGFSSLKQLYPAISPKLWQGRTFIDNKIIISNLFNHTQTPVAEGWSVRKTQILDFRGRKLTYDSHNATDFAVPVGSSVNTAAPGEIVAVISEYNRGGLKIFIDHGQGIMTSYAHLARSLVKAGEFVHRGQTIAISGYSGIDGTVTYPFGIPHVHFNVWLNSKPVDPFPFGNNVSMWLAGQYPGFPLDNNSLFTSSDFQEERVNEAINYIKTERVRNWLNSIPSLRERAFQTIIHQNYYPTRFIKRINLYESDYVRIPILDLPFSANDFDGIVFLDDILEDRRRMRKKIYKK